ncbi:hypothetical protein Tco_0690617 [Tanacetum coccineum]
MSNTNNTMLTQTSNALHNAIIEAGGKDRPPMLAPSNYNPPYKFKWTEKTVPVAEGIDNDIYSTFDACLNACVMWKSIERLKQGESINVQDLETNLYWEFGKFTSRDGESLESYYSGGTRYDNQRAVKVVEAKENVGIGSTLYVHGKGSRGYSRGSDNFGPIYDIELLQSTNGETIDQDDDDLAKERDLLAS